MIIETRIDFLLPSWWEVEVSVAASFFVIAAYWFFTYDGHTGSGDRSLFDNSSVVSGDRVDDREKEQQHSELHASSSSLNNKKPVKVLEESVQKKQEPFVQEDVLTGIYNDAFASTTQQFFDVLLSDGSSFTNVYRSVRKDTNLNIGQWHSVDEYTGKVREITFRCLCNSPMCPPDTAMTEWQHALLSADKKSLVFETVQHAHDVPFGSYFKVHCRWTVVTTFESSCTIDVKVGVHFKKWCVMKSKIKSGAISEYKKEVELMLEVARSCINSNTVIDETTHVVSSV
ncbi:hypothetical protein SSX86_013060 [Deinandra increscens subsp. villosa]|uniref:VASt domain-containing protein n=1 Tax=Deinandra increscens subsp. villosa TaxID=3103831 RepID=A0AAP0D5S2_9ASTR